MLFKEHVGDRTNWRAMLKGDVAELDLKAERDRLMAATASGSWATEKVKQGGKTPFASWMVNIMPFTIPLRFFPSKIVSHNFDKQPDVQRHLARH